MLYDEILYNAGVIWWGIDVIYCDINPSLYQSDVPWYGCDLTWYRWLSTWVGHHMVEIKWYMDVLWHNRMWLHKYVSFNLCLNMLLHNRPTVTAWVSLVRHPSVVVPPSVKPVLSETVKQPHAKFCGNVPSHQIPRSFSFAFLRFNFRFFFSFR